jgi:AAA family ATP:ADP antiporter
MADYQKWVGIASIIVMLFTSIMIRKLSWLTSAIATPIVMLTTGSIFFSWISFDQLIIQFLSEHSYLIFAVFIGTIHIILAKSSKFSLFDATKELAYIPLEENLRDKGKAAVDLLSERIGKSGGALLQSALFIMIPNASYGQFAPLFLFVSICFWFIWLIAIKSLNKKYLDYARKI